MYNPSKLMYADSPELGLLPMKEFQELLSCLNAESTFERPGRPSTGFQVRWKRPAADE